MSLQPRKRLGTLLVDAGFLTNEQLNQALAVQKESKEKRLGKVLIDLGFVTEEDLLKVLQRQLNVPRVEMSELVVQEEALEAVPESLARRHQVFPVRLDGKHLTLAMADPLNVLAIDDVRAASGRHVTPVLAREEEITRAINSWYGMRGSTEEVIRDIEHMGDIQEDDDESLARLRQVVEQAPIVKLANLIIAQGVREGASDIHVEPQKDSVRVRYRIDGLLHEHMVVPKVTQAALTSRLKVMADLDIAEKRVPQDGRIRTEIDGEEIDLRLSTLPTVFGEKVVMRILRKDLDLISLDNLGFDNDLLHLYRDAISKPYGMILVTGPTGSGKTTSLYATLREISSPEKNVITVEDPVEYAQEGLNQVQIHVAAGLTFAQTLRSIVRQDPDIIMVGEIRDAETAKIAVQAAMTGHLVLSTIHTNDAAGAMVRLEDMGVEPYLVASSLIAVLAQRLARKLCVKCREPYEIDGEEAYRVGLVNADERGRSLTIYRAKGCRSCHNTGYRGRVGIHELLIMDENVRRVILARGSKEEIVSAASVRRPWRSLFQDGLEKVRWGVTSLEEVIRVAYTGD